MSWFKRLLPGVSTTEKKGVPEGVWSKCPNCSSVLYNENLVKNHNVCPKCDHHLRLSARERIALFLDKGSQVAVSEGVLPVDRLKFKDSKKYRDRLSSAQKVTSEEEAVTCAQGTLHGLPVMVIAFDFFFIGGSMSAAVGERFVRAVERAIEISVPVVCFSTSGGARMQEGLFSLFQMARTSAALARLAKVKLPFVSVLCDPTMGGVSASLAMLGDVIVAEPKALIGFSGPRVIEQTIREVLPEGFQRSEFLLQHGAIDMIVDRRQMRQKIATILSHLLKVELPLASLSADTQSKTE